ncbi:MAG: EF-hand domain-containing protein [Brucellaceae bacterium]|nr:EF-hand domain-containing protein [Brucellaceae bacterium]
MAVPGFHCIGGDDAKKERPMNKTTKLALAFATFAALATTASAAEPKWRHGYDGPRQGMMDGRRGDMRGGQRDGMMRRGMDREQMFDRADADNSGDVTYEEFAAAFGGRFTSADADKNGELTVGEVADGIQRMMAERMAARVIERFDANNDGKLTVAEIESQQKKLFALADRDDDGKVTKEELQRRPGFDGQRRGWFGDRGR